MSVTVQIRVAADSGLPTLHQLLGELQDRTGLNRSIAAEAENLTREYLRGLAPARHRTAQRLGATPTGHLERAAESVSSRSDAAAATVSVTSPGMIRAFRPVTLTPGAGKKYLTIPATAEAYGQRAGAFNDLRFALLGGKPALIQAAQSSLATRTATGGRVFYWLKRSVHQPQDRTLLPSDAAFAAAAEEGAVSYLSLLANQL